MVGLAQMFSLFRRFILGLLSLYGTTKPKRLEIMSVSQDSDIINAEGYQNNVIGSKVIAILLNM